MAEHKSYYGAVPDTDGDLARTAELKKFSKEAPVGRIAEEDFRNAVMDKASREVARRTKKYMLFNNLDYFEASQRVIQSDSDLARLYAFGHCQE